MRKGNYWYWAVAVSAVLFFTIFGLSYLKKDKLDDQMAYISKKYRYSVTVPSSAGIFERGDFYLLPFTGNKSNVLMGENFDEHGVKHNEKDEALGYLIQLWVEENNAGLPMKELVDRKLKKAEESDTIPLLPFHKQIINISGYEAYLLDYDNGSLAREIVIGNHSFVYRFTLSIDLPRSSRLAYDPHWKQHNKIFKNILIGFRFINDKGNIITPPQEGKIIYPPLPTLD